jgi:succinate dehydrogenase / fumarate reductase cytochrome b subunit
MRVTSILLKVLMAITGLAWFGFSITHLTANFLILKGADAFNGYAEGLAKFGPLLWVAEAGLVLLLLAHVGSAFRVTRMNTPLRPEAGQPGQQAQAHGHRRRHRPGGRLGRRQRWANSATTS